MAHPRVEEVSDSDPEIDDPSQFLPDSDQSIIAPANIPFSASSSSTSRTPSHQQQQQKQPPQFSSLPQTLAPPREGNAQAREKIKSYCTLYPIYFDASRTKRQGRRVSSSLAITNPLAYNLLPAIRHALGNTPLHMAFEPDKTHPKDWANPGRVRIQMFDSETHAPLHPVIKSKAHLYSLVGKFLKENPTEKLDPLELKIQNLPVPSNFGKEDIPRPRGWKMGSVLPVHSAAVSGGGVSDNFFKEAMEEMKAAQAAGALPAGAGGGGGGGMPDMSALQNMMGGMGGMGGLGGLMGGGGGGGGGSDAGSGTEGKRKKDKKKG